ncbi:hypothetical protein [Wenyingzhuangia sp. IMCC45574]
MEKETQHSEDFLKEFTQGKNPFKTPDNYFNNLSERIHIASVEQELPKETGFKVPNNYFENFTVKRSRSKIIKLLPYTSVAAAFIFGFFLFKQGTNTDIQLQDDNVISYLTYEENIEYDEIISNLTINNEDLSEINLDGDYVNIEQLSLELSEYDLVEF